MLAAAKFPALSTIVGARVYDHFSIASQKMLAQSIKLIQYISSSMCRNKWLANLIQMPLLTGRIQSDEPHSAYALIDSPTTQ